MHIDDEVTARTAKASVAFCRLRLNVWERNGIRLDTKLRVYKDVVLPTLLYACETWTVYQRHAKKLNHFHLSSLRKILKTRWPGKIPDTEVLQKANMQSVHTLLKLAQLRLTGHVTRMPGVRLSKKVLYGELHEEKRTQGGQKKHYKDTLKASLKDFNIPTESWEQAAQDRTKWHCLINKGTSQFEAKGICEAERNRKERKARAKGPSSDPAQSEFTCTICNRQFRAQIGLYGHQRTHKHTYKPNIQDLRWSFSVMRDEQSMDEDEINVPPNFLFYPSLNFSKINSVSTIVLCI